MNVRWLGIDPTRLHDFWDCTIVADLLDGRIWRPAGYPTFEHHMGPAPNAGGVTVIAGGEYRDRIGELNDIYRGHAPVATIIVKDEGSAFPAGNIKYGVGGLWVQNARRDRHGSDVRPFPVGWTPGTRAAVLRAPSEKTLDWCFAGQVTHARRRQCVAQIDSLPGGHLLETPGFLQGMPYPEYMAMMCAAKVAPCPGGVITPDSFRVWEALEAGAIPLVDTHGGRGEVDAYWPNLLRREIPFPVIGDWMEAPGHMRRLLDGWPYHANRIESWWGIWKRDFVYRVYDDIRGGETPVVKRPGDRITVLMPTSSIPSHPDTGIIEQTLASVRGRPELAGCEIIVMCDGLRDQHKERRPAYEEYIRRLHRLCKQWANMLVLVFDRPMHQSGMTSEALKHVRTPAVLFVEHDTPIVGEIPFEPLVDAVLSDADVVRLHHEVMVLAAHAHMMPDHRSSDGARAYCEVKQVAGVPMVRTFQWSQRPHVANAGFYRQIMEEHFDNRRDPMFIEDRMHGIVETAWRRHAEAGWMRYRLWMYHPGDGSQIQRSVHLDGRAGEAKAG